MQTSAQCCSQVVETPADADFILAHGTEAVGQPDGLEPQAVTMQDIKRLLQSCAEQRPPLPMMVANPDVVTVSGSDLIPMPGTLAEHYAGLGGQVCSVGSNLLAACQCLGQHLLGLHAVCELPPCGVAWRHFLLSWCQKSIAGHGVNPSIAAINSQLVHCSADFLDGQARSCDL